MTLRGQILLWLLPALLVFFGVVGVTVQALTTQAVHQAFLPTGVSVTHLAGRLEQESSGVFRGVSGVGGTAVAGGVLQQGAVYMAAVQGQQATLQELTVASLRNLPDRLSQTLLWSGCLAMLLAWTLAAWGILRVMRPLGLMQQELESRSARHLQPIEVQAIPEFSRAIDALNHLMLDLQRTLERSEQQERAARHFAYGASHELRNPLGAIRLFMDAARRHPESGAAWHGLETQLSRTERLLDALLHLTRLEGAATPVREPLDLCALLQTEHPGDIEGEAFLPGDGALIQMAFRNLLINAQQHGAKVSRITVTTEGDQVWVRVYDQGPGIPEGVLDRVFEPFVKQSEGTGLGLALVRAVAQLHGGSVQASNHREGACVGFSVRA